MNDYILKYESDNEWLSHHGILGQRKGVIRSFVGKYYIPKNQRKFRQEKNDLKDINKLKGKKMSELSDKELDTLLERTKKEQMTSNFIKNTKKNESGDSTSVRDLSKSAQNLSSTLNDINRNAQRNKPIKKTKQIDLSDKSSAEIRSMIEHARLEQEYNSIVNTPQTRNGKAKVTAALAAVGTAAVVGTQVADFVITAKKLKE